jgi:hypothetical protein
MPITFPTTGLTPNVTTYTYSGLTWLWTGSVWQSVGSVSVQGTQGIQGPQGTQSVQGTQGIQGLTGTAGIGSAVAPVILTGSTVSFDTSVSNTFTNNQTFAPTSTSVVPVITKAAASQTADLLQNKNSSNIIHSGVNAAGQIYAGNTSSSVTTGISTTALLGASISFTSTTATYTFAATVTSAVNPVVPGQTVVITNMSPAGYNGTYVVLSTGGSSGAWTFTTANTTNATVVTATGTIRVSPTAAFTSTTPYTAGLVVQAGTASQLANTVDVLNSAGAAIAYISNGGSIFTNGNFITTGFLFGNGQNGSSVKPNNNTANTLNAGPVTVQSSYGNQLPLVVKGSPISSAITAATANGTTSVVYTSTFSTYIVVGMTVTITGIVSTGNVSATAGTGFNITAGTVSAATSTTFTVTAPAALTDTYTSGGTFTYVGGRFADLQQWQNSSSTVLSAIDTAGNFTKGDGDQLVLASQIF